MIGRSKGVSKVIGEVAVVIMGLEVVYWMFRGRKGCFK